MKHGLPGPSVPLGAGVYVHIPFCASRCDYCAFATWTDRHELRSVYVDALIRQIRAAQHEGGGLPPGAAPWPEAARVATVYLGGGTPSQLEVGDLERLLGAIDRLPGAEVTIEANPEDVTEKWAGAAGAAGATRISLGVQSLDPAVLAGLGRAHEPRAVPKAAAAIAAAGISSYSVDLIYGGAGETDQSWLATLQGVLDLDPAPSHVSAYALTVEPGTPLWRDPARHPDDDVQAARYELADRLLGAAGLFWYELSNWARPGHESRHNQNYWAQGDYLAIGAAAHGHRAGARWWNLRTPERYIAAVAAGRTAIAASETLSEVERRTEALELALRTPRGVPASSLPLDCDAALGALVEPAARAGHVALTLAGRRLANEVSRRLLPPMLSTIT
ncbi:MAG: radical SAM family heme chaperone HemW [Acidimicrobiales bacterium]